VREAHRRSLRVILAFGSYFARFVGNAVVTCCKSVDIKDADLLGKLAQYAIMAFVVLIALEQIEVGASIVRQTFRIALAGIVFALAFGSGGKGRAARALVAQKQNVPRAVSVITVRGLLTRRARATPDQRHPEWSPS
jgi:hypothetical protein